MCGTPLTSFTETPVPYPQSLYERMAYADVITNFSFIDCFPISTAIKAPLPRMPRSYTTTKPLPRSKHTLTSFGALLLIGKSLSISTGDHHYQNLWQRLYLTECVNFKHSSKPWTIPRCSLYETCWLPVVHRTKLSLDTIVWTKRES